MLPVPVWYALAVVCLVMNWLLTLSWEKNMQQSVSNDQSIPKPVWFALNEWSLCVSTVTHQEVIIQTVIQCWSTAEDIMWAAAADMASSMKMYCSTALDAQSPRCLICSIERPARKHRLAPPLRSECALNCFESYPKATRSARKRDTNLAWLRPTIMPWLR